MDQLARSPTPESRDGVWVSADGTRALAVAQTAASGSTATHRSKALTRSGRRSRPRQALRRSPRAATCDCGSAGQACSPSRRAPRSNARRCACRSPAASWSSRCCGRLSIVAALGTGAVAGGSGAADRHRCGRAGIWRRSRHHARFWRHLDRRVRRLLDLFLHPIGRRRDDDAALSWRERLVADGSLRHAHLGVRIRLDPALGFPGLKQLGLYRSSASLPPRW